MIKPGQLTDGSTQPYGFGLRIQQIRGRAALVHGGAGRGLDTDSVYIPSENLFVAVLANSDAPATDPSIVARRLAALALGQPFPTFDRAVSALSVIQPLLGAYGAESGAQWRFFSRDGKLYLGRGDDEMEAFAAGQDRFSFGPERLMWFSIARKPGGAHVMELHNPEAAAPVRTTRIGPVPAALTVPNAKLQSYTGTFQTETVTMTIAMAANGALTVAPSGQRALSMRPVSDTEFRIEGGMMRIVFHPENGQVDLLTIYRGARELHGRRVVPGAAGPEVRPKG